MKLLIISLSILGITVALYLSSQPREQVPNFTTKIQCV